MRSRADILPAVLSLAALAAAALFGQAIAPLQFRQLLFQLHGREL